MARGSRKKKKNRQPKLPTIVSPSARTTENAPLPLGVAKLQPDKTVLISKEILVMAPVESCFGILAKQLEQSPQWDPIIVNVRPVSESRGRIGATSQVTLNLGGRKVESQAMISHYYPNYAISWVTTRKPKVRQDWRLELKSHGTMVRVTLAHELDGWGIRRLIYKVTRQKRVEQDLDKMLAQLKAVAESINRNQMA